jgi:hypothetical protein
LWNIQNVLKWEKNAYILVSSHEENHA